MTKITDLYIKKFTKEIPCEDFKIQIFKNKFIIDNDLLEAVNSLKTEDENFIIDNFLKNIIDYEKQLTQFIEDNTKRSYQLLKIKGRFPLLHKLVIDNWDLIDIIDKPLLFTKEEFNTILESCNFDKSIDRIPIFVDSNNIFCTFFKSEDKTNKTIEIKLKEL